MEGFAGCRMFLLCGFCAQPRCRWQIAHFVREKWTPACNHCISYRVVSLLGSIFVFVMLFKTWPSVRWLWSDFHLKKKAVLFGSGAISLPFFLCGFFPLWKRSGAFRPRYASGVKIKMPQAQERDWVRDNKLRIDGFNKVEFNVLSSVLTKSEHPLEPAIMNSYSRLFLQFQRSLFPAPDRVRKWRSVHYANSASLQQTLLWWWWMSNTVYRDMLCFFFFWNFYFCALIYSRKHFQLNRRWPFFNVSYAEKWYARKKTPARA